MKTGATRKRKIYRGQEFNLSIAAIGQWNSTVSTKVITETSDTARLERGQRSQTLQKNCSNLVYILYSSQENEQLTLYPDGPCRDTGSARVAINVTLLPCPDAFALKGDECVCEERLQEYNANCSTTGEVISITHGTNFLLWMNASYTDNGSYEGLILCQPCPVQYCKTESVSITLDNPDIQCDLNHSGVLCGACKINYSLMIGSSQCAVCSNKYLALLLPFALAGIALIAFLSVLKLTVATGMINSLILYANFIQVNRRLFLPAERVNILTVFIAWLNLDLGFETCFFDGMNAYIQTWHFSCVYLDLD